MNIKVYYRRNLKMSEGKLAAQVGHCVANYTEVDPNTETVLGIFYEE